MYVGQHPKKGSKYEDSLRDSFAQDGKKHEVEAHANQGAEGGEATDHVDAESIAAADN